MKAVVCMKQTPSTTAVYTVANGEVNWDDPGGKPHVLNPWDEYSVEEAIRLCENHGASSAVALTMGDESALEQLKFCLAMGCNEAVLVNDDSFAGSDTLGTARVLAAAINNIEDAQVVVFGKQAIDGDTGQTPVQVAVKLGWTPLTFVSAIKEISDGEITVERLIEDGKQTVTTSLPVVISVVKEINEPRYPSFMGIRKANRANIPTWSADDLGVDGGTGSDASKVDWSNVYQLPARDVATEIIEGDSVAEKASKLVDRLFEEKVI
jgi:electron transfer flavoprotein beta subunit